MLRLARAPVNNSMTHLARALNNLMEPFSPRTCAPDVR